MRRIVALVCVLLAGSSPGSVRSLNPAFFGTWTGSAPTGNLCTGKKNKTGQSPIALTIEPPDIKPLQNYIVHLKSDWGCFAPMTTPGFVFGDEFWAAADDRMTFVRLRFENDGTLSGNFRFDLNGSILRMDFKGLKKRGEK